MMMTELMVVMMMTDRIDGDTDNDDGINGGNDDNANATDVHNLIIVAGGIIMYIMMTRPFSLQGLLCCTR